MVAFYPEINPQTKVFGVIGNPIGHSLSPLMHNLTLRALGINGVYLAFQVAPNELESAIRSIRALGVTGVNVTVPYKTMVLPYLDELRGDAALTGSVNTIHNEDGRLVGYSTDGIGFVRSLQQEAGWVAKDQSVIILGTGGAAKAIAFHLITEGISRLLVLSRTEEKAEEFSRIISEKTSFSPDCRAFGSESWREEAKNFSLVINTTPVGMASVSNDKPPFDPEWSAPDALLCDLIYNPLETPWLKEGRLAGRKTLSGLGMLVYQGAEAFRLWTGREMPVNEVFKALREKLGRK